MKAIVTICLAALLAQGAFAQDSHPAPGDERVMHSHHPTPEESDGAPGTITGYVRDIACLVRNQKAGAATTPLTRDCLDKCVRGGSPLAILTEEGWLYLPISDEIPDKDVRSQLLPYVGKYVRASGKVFERGGLHSISIDKIKRIDRPS